MNNQIIITCRKIIDLESGAESKINIQYLKMNSTFIDVFAVWTIQNDKFVFTHINDGKSLISFNIDEPLAVISNVDKYLIVKNILLIFSKDDYLIFYDTQEKSLKSLCSTENLTKYHEYESVLKIANFLASLPSEKLKDMAHTKSLRETYNIHRLHNKMVSIYFLKACFVNENFEILFEQTKEFKDWHKKVVNVNICMAYLYRSLWELLKLTFPYMKNPSLQIEEIFMNILEEVKNSKYLDLFEKDYIEFSPRKKSSSNKNIDNQKYFSNKWLELIFKNVEMLIKKDDSEANILMKNYQTASIELTRTIEILFKARTEVGMLVPSEIWIDQICFILDKNNKPSIQPFE